MFKDKCHKCGRNIWNGIPEEHKDHISEYIEEMKKVMGINDDSKVSSIFDELHDKIKTVIS